MNTPASPKGNGRALRRARAVVKRWEKGSLFLVRFYKRTGEAIADPKKDPVLLKRYERAQALLLAQKLSQ